MNNTVLSPHLTIYSPQFTSILSIFHRLTGALLSIVLLGLILVFSTSKYLLSSFLFYNLLVLLDFLTPLILFNLLFSFNFHLVNGLRHLIWDNVSFFDIKSIYTTSFVVLFLSFLLTAGIFEFGSSYLFYFI